MLRHTFFFYHTIVDWQYFCLFKLLIKKKFLNFMSAAHAHTSHLLTLAFYYCLIIFIDFYYRDDWDIVRGSCGQRTWNLFGV